MKLLTDYTNHPVFNYTPKLARVNIIPNIIKDFDINIDLQLCSHCFYDSKKIPPLIMDPSCSKNKTKKKVANKKNKSMKK